MRSAEVRELFGYLYWIRDRVLTAAEEAGPGALLATRRGASRDLRATLVHELDVESGWRARLSGDEEIDLDPADFPTTNSIAEHWQRDEAEMKRWLAALTDEALAAPPPRETDQSFPLWYYLMHVVSHGIQELEEAVALMGGSGRAPQNLGFLDYADSTIERHSRLASGYDRWAGSDAYERYIGRWSRPVADQFVGWLDVPPGRRWLDVGCGTGALSEAILRRSAPASVIGVDPLEPFIARASAELTDPRASFRLGSAADTGLPDRAADVVAAGLVLNFVPDVGAALAEWRRVLAPRGVVGAYVWDYIRGMGFIRQFWDAAVAVDPAAAALDQGGLTGISAAGHLEAAFRAAGFVAVEAGSIAIPTVFTDFDDLWLPFLGGTGGAPGYVATLDDAHRDAIREQLRGAVVTEPDGSIHLEANAWAVRARGA